MIRSGYSTKVVLQSLFLIRQIIHDELQTGKEKAASAVEHMSRINSSLVFNSLICKLTSDNAMDIISKYDLVVDATDNIDARYTINDCCVLLCKPFISGSSVSMDGQITTVIPYTTPCYRCLYPHLSVSMGSCRSCADAGVLGPIPGLIGCLEAIEAIKLLLNRDKYITAGSPPNSAANSSSPKELEPRKRTNGKGAAQMKPLLGRQVQYDAVSGEFHTFQLPPRNIHCAVCGDNPTVTNMEESKATLQPTSHPTPPPLTDAENSSSTASLSLPQSTLPELPEANRITVQAFAEQVLRGGKAEGLGLIVDVRSAEQFSITRLQDSSILTFSSLDECTAKLFAPAVGEVDKAGGDISASCIIPDGVRTVQVSVPLSELRGGRVAAQREMNQSGVLAQLSSIRTALTAHTQATQRGAAEVASEAETAAENMTESARARTQAEPAVFVLCRRGIDSVTVTQLLFNSGALGASVFNVEGGLTAWSQQVDTTFAMY